MPAERASQTSPGGVCRPPQNDHRMHIVHAGVEHLESLVPLLDAYRTFYLQPSDEPAAREFLRLQFAQHSSTIVLALGAGETAAALGFVQLFPAYSSVALRRSWILEDLFVAPQARRRGVGRALLHAAVEHARASGAAAIFLETARENLAAQALYESQGWTREALFLKYNFALG